MNLINLTGISVAYRSDGTLHHVDPSGWRLLAPRSYLETGEYIGDVPICRVQHTLPDLPPPETDTIYIVDPIIAAALQEHGVFRDDMIVSHGASAEKDDSGKVVATRRFVLANPKED